MVFEASGETAARSWLSVETLTIAPLSQQGEARAGLKPLPTSRPRRAGQEVLRSDVSCGGSGAMAVPREWLVRQP